jgi:hypothetical protein
LQFKKRITENYNELFTRTEGRTVATRAEGFSNKWGWYQSIYSLCNGDIKHIATVTKINVHTCMQHLAFEKDKMELENEILKRNAKR